MFRINHVCSYKAPSGQSRDDRGRGESGESSGSRDRWAGTGASRLHRGSSRSQESITANQARAWARTPLAPVLPSVRGAPGRNRLRRRSRPDRDHPPPRAARPAEHVGAGRDPSSQAADTSKALTSHADDAANTCCDTDRLLPQELIPCQTRTRRTAPRQVGTRRAEVARALSTGWGQCSWAGSALRELRPLGGS